MAVGIDCIVHLFSILPAMLYIGSIDYWNGHAEVNKYMCGLVYISLLAVSFFV